MIRPFAVLVLGCLSAQCQTITHTFGSDSNSFSIDFVEIGNPGVGADSTGFGKVEYIYNIGKYEVSRDLVIKANLIGNLNITILNYTSITNPIGNGDGLKRPAAGISWFEAAKFVNWLNTNKGHQAAYFFDASGNFQKWSSENVSGSNFLRHKNAFYFLPSIDEWYKAAYGSPSGTWYNYPTGSDAMPSSSGGGTVAGTAVYGQGFSADIDSAGGLSAYGTMAQGGNVAEWTDTAGGQGALGSEGRRIAGGGYYDPVVLLEATTQGFSYPETESFYGFRVAMIPEPSSFSLLLAGGAVLAAGRRRS